MTPSSTEGPGRHLDIKNLCRIFRQDGYRVAPFKGQNMALNSCITSKGLEMSRAQAVQAEAAGLEPDPRMNPVLLKPSSDTGSQLIVNGRPRGHYQAADYFKLKPGLIPEVLAAYHSLAAEQDIIVIEGAGSPAEINLGKDCFVNMGLAELVNAPVLLVGDIDRGGVFAQLYGTVALLEEERARIVGTIINKFRGDVSLLRPGLGQLEKLTGVPVLGVVPYLRVDIDDEDSLSPRLERKSHGAPVDIAVIRLPHIANFADLAPLERHPALGVRYVERVTELGGPDLVILPQTADGDGDMAWLRESGLEEAIRERVPVLEIREPGMFDSGVETKKLADRLLARKGLPPVDFCPMARRDYQEEQFDLLARGVRDSLDLPAIYRAMERYERGKS